MRWKPKNRAEWREWYAWHPVRTTFGEWVWLERVWRSYGHHGVWVGPGIPIETWAYRDWPPA